MGGPAGPHCLRQRLPRGLSGSHQAPRLLILAAAGKGLAGLAPLPLPLRFFQRGGLTFSNICAIMVGLGPTGRARRAPPLAGCPWAAKEAFSVRGTLLFFGHRYPKRTPCGFRLESNAAPYMALFPHHPDSPGPGGPCGPTDFSRLTVPKKSTVFHAAAPAVNFSD